uniref:transmembrane 4 L6 family member 1-like n=1 Tax=Pristiophorus japonicus TaxID=55135 RepID=UPI00398F6E15
MCPRECAGCIAVSLFPVIFFCVVANLLLFFPNWSLVYIQEQHLTVEVLYLGGAVGGGFLVLFPAMHFLAISKKQYCGERCGMCLSVLFALISVLGATYCFGISALGLIYGPFCQHSQGSRDLKWGRPFEDNLTEFGPGSYLFNQTLWSQCIEPKNIVLFNLVLFTVQLGSSAIEVFLCFIQMINGLVGCICGERRRPQR